MAFSPCPAIDSNFSIALSGVAPFFVASSMMAFAKGWFDPASTLASYRSISCSLKSLNALTSVTCGFPSVSVPVLSSTIAWIFETCSRVGASFIRILCFAPRPVPTATAVGVASPSASGQAITTVAIAKERAKRRGEPTIKYQIINTKRPDPTAAMTKYFANLSAILCPGAFEFCASSTIRTIRARAVSLPIFVALNLTEPVVLIDPPIT